MLNATVCNKALALLDKRCVSKYLNRDRLSKSVRQRFLDYYVGEHGHGFVRSSPVVPYCDASVAFVNAGMNQFKGVFLGTQTAPHPRVANTQKCVRVGGKHNDLAVVGTDGYHHTFFEMLGSWSFGSYQKKEACEMAWKLLTDVFKINKNMLYVTYFKGNPQLGLPADEECREIWRALRVPEDRIIGFGMDDNFWEMGTAGPCGPCTEIHVDMRGLTNRAKFVNKGLHDLQEIWNIVFIQYKRNEDGSIQKLQSAYIDTGMGFERLCAFLQGKISNYDTDLFSPIFNVIPKICKDTIPSYNGVFGEKDWNHLHTNYRILADHTRMLTVCLSDGVIPEANQKLRRVMRKAFFISDSVFKKESGLVKELTNYVIDILGNAYPELEKNINYIHQIIDYEEDLYRHLRSRSTFEWNSIIEKQPHLADLDILEMPGLLSAYKNIKDLNLKEISPQYGFKLYDTYGLDEDSIVKLANRLKLPLDLTKFRSVLEASKQKSRLLSARSTAESLNEISEKIRANKIPTTEDKYKYNYKKVDNNYVFDGVDAKILFILKGDKPVKEIYPNETCSVIFDKTNLYYESGGQSSDRGYGLFDEGIFEITDLDNINGCVLHKGRFKSTRKVVLGEILTLTVDEGRRLKNMCNHTAVHLLNAVLRKIKGATMQKSSRVNDRFLTFDVGIFGDKLNADDVLEIEKQIGEVIHESVGVKTSEINSQELVTQDNVTTVPGETYPEMGIRLVEIWGRELISREPCCGTHVRNTSDIIDFCVTGCKSLGRSTASVQAVTGHRARLVRENGLQIFDDIGALKKRLDEHIDRPEIFDDRLMKIRWRLNATAGDYDAIPFTMKQHGLEELENINKKIKAVTRDSLKEIVEMEMKNAMESKVMKSKSNKKFIVHYLRSSTMLDSIPLQKATKLCEKTPVLVISYTDSMVKARCCVPEEALSSNFNAETWLSTVSTIFKSIARAPKGQNPKLVCNMKPKRVNIQEWDTLLKEGLNVAMTFAEKQL